MIEVTHAAAMIGHRLTSREARLGAALTAAVLVLAGSTAQAGPTRFDGTLSPVGAVRVQSEAQPPVGGPSVTSARLIVTPSAGATGTLNLSLNGFAPISLPVGFLTLTGGVVFDDSLRPLSFTLPPGGAYTFAMPTARSNTAWTGVSFAGLGHGTMLVSGSGGGVAVVGGLLGTLRACIAGFGLWATATAHSSTLRSPSASSESPGPRPPSRGSALFS